MSKTNKSEATETTETEAAMSQATTAPDADLGIAQLHETFDKANEQGFFGVEVDSTPNENYTLRGVTSGAKTPETDKNIAQQDGKK